METNGYMVLKEDWTLDGYNYEGVGTTHEILKKCPRKFRFYGALKDCFNRYYFEPSDRVVEILATGEVEYDDETNDYYAKTIKIVREYSWYEVLDLLNAGKYNTGVGNTGDLNTGENNSGDMNTGLCNAGYGNAGDHNDGDHNTGDRNTEDWNAGDYNSGRYNTGNCNTGSSNVGNYNRGDMNTGDHNPGSYNTGDWNSGSHQRGIFCTERNPRIEFFDKRSRWTWYDWTQSKARQILDGMPRDHVVFVSYSEMSEDERAEHPEAKTTGGYLKEVITENSDRREWWYCLPVEQQKEIMRLPHFNADKFYEITGIVVKW
ncbi:hypothetical protein IKE72_00695 [Candidatus Saccharibacteria bacterium]|nr:hypothetical protein [Candidatus Saccharibacteria bacterium]